jgi:hypothetical protein
LSLLLRHWRSIGYAFLLRLSPLGYHLLAVVTFNGAASSMQF